MRTVVGETRTLLGDSDGRDESGDELVLRLRYRWEGGVDESVVRDELGLRAMAEA